MWVFVYCNVVQSGQQVEQQVVASKSFVSHKCKRAKPTWCSDGLRD